MKTIALLIVTFLLNPIFSYSMGSCEILFSNRLDQETLGSIRKEYVYGRLVEYEHVRVSDSSYKEGSASLVDSRGAIFIGFTESGHTYIIVNDRRIDPQAIFVPAVVSTPEKDIFDPGVIVRVEDPNGLLGQKIQNLFNDRSWRSPSCVFGTCKLLGASEMLTIGKDKDGKFIILPTTFFKRLVKNGIFDRDGNRVETRIIVLGNKSLRSLTSGWEGSMIAVGLIYGFLGGIVGVAGSIYFYSILSSLF